MGEIKPPQFVTMGVENNLNRSEHFNPFNHALRPKVTARYCSGHANPSRLQIPSEDKGLDLKAPT